VSTNRQKRAELGASGPFCRTEEKKNEEEEVLLDFNMKGVRISNLMKTAAARYYWYWPR
jgi:hypothetical protein